MRSLTGRKIPIIIAVFSAVCVIAGLLLALVIRSTTVHTGILEVTDPDVMAESDILIRYMLTQADERTRLRSYEDESADLLNIMDTADTILVVESDGGLQQLQGSFLQDLTVLEVLRCAEPSVTAGSRIQLYSNGGMLYENSQIYYEGPYYRNILHSGKTYLVFLEYPEAGRYADTPYFNPINNMFAVIDLDRSHALGTCPSYDFNASRDVMHLTSSARFAAFFAAQEEILLAEYLGDRYE